MSSSDAVVAELAAAEQQAQQTQQPVEPSAPTE